MKIADIYKKFGIPPNLQEHMFRVCAVTSIIEKHWKGEGKIDWEEAKKMALVHDLGNVVKLDNKNHPEFLGSEQVNLDYWNNKQEEMIVRYGIDDNEATRKMLLEIGISKEIADKVFDKRFLNSIITNNSTDWSLKILYYADLRVLPLRIGTLTERLDDIRERYNPVYTERPDFEDLIKACYEVEKQIQDNLNIPVNDITDLVVKDEIKIDKYLDLSI
jgi:hypothetical protein